jgi:hypothetical protein
MTLRSNAGLRLIPSLSSETVPAFLTSHSLSVVVPKESYLIGSGSAGLMLHNLIIAERPWGLWVQSLLLRLRSSLDE